MIYNSYKWVNIYNQDGDDTVYVRVFIFPITKFDYKKKHYFTTLINWKEGIEDTMRTYITNIQTIDSLRYNGNLLYANSYFAEPSIMRKIITIEKEIKYTSECL